MITVKLPDKTIGLSFRHSDVDVLIPDSNPAKFRTTKGTFCEIYEVKLKEDGTKSVRWICEGSAIVHPLDKFEKKVGRKIALTKALNFLKPAFYGEKRAISPIILGKKERELVWEAYHRRGVIEGEKVKSEVD